MATIGEWESGEIRADKVLKERVRRAAAESEIFSRL